MTLDPAYTTNLLRPFSGLGPIEQNTTEFYDTYHSNQASLNRRFRNGFSFGANYTYGISYTGNTGLGLRLHAPDGTISVRDDQDEFEELNKTLDRRPHPEQRRQREPHGLARLRGESPVDR